MEKIKGRWYGSCHECGHSHPIAHESEPLVYCVPKRDLIEKYANGCEYLIPRCPEVCITEEDFLAMREEGKKRVKA